jgi:hypothetical protein
MACTRSLTQPLRWLLLTAAIGLLAACGGGGGGYGGGSANTGGGGGGGGAMLEATFDSIQANVFTPICTACHIGAAAPQGLRLDAVNSYGLLVGVASSEQPGVLRVDPGDPDASYLIQKLEGTAAVGNRMPLNQAPLTQTQIDAIRQWIIDGAQRDAPAMPTEPIRVSSLSPLPDSSFTALPGSITALFDRDLDATSVTSASFTLERSGGDGTFEDGNEVALALNPTVPLANPATASADLSALPSVADTYRVRLLGTGGASILDLDANALDGEFGGAFPSGDGTAGGDFTATFSVVDVQPNLQSIQDNVFTPTCANNGCHTGPTSSVLPAGMDLTSAAASHASLVGVTSLQDPALERVSVADPSASYLIRKLEGDQAAGTERMPFGGPYIDQDTIDAIRQWIAAGADP